MIFPVQFNSSSVRNLLVELCWPGPHSPFRHKNNKKFYLTLSWGENGVSGRFKQIFWRRRKVVPSCQDNAIAVDISDLREKIWTSRLTAMTMSQYLYFSVSGRWGEACVISYGYIRKKSCICTHSLAVKEGDFSREKISWKERFEHICLKLELAAAEGGLRDTK